MIKIFNNNFNFFFRLAGTNEDKLRLFIIYYLCNQNLSQSELDDYLIPKLKEIECDLGSISYIKSYKTISKMNYSNQFGDTTTGTVK